MPADLDAIQTEITASTTAVRANIGITVGIVGDCVDQYSPAEQKEIICAAWNWLGIVQAAIREAKDRLNDTALAHIQRHGDIQVGPTQRLYEGREKTYVIRPNADVIASILTATGGDLGVLRPGDGGVLVSSPWKFGTLKTVLGQPVFDELFLQVETPDVKTGAAKGPKVMVADDQFRAVR